MKKSFVKKTVKFFKRWTRNSYGAFASMHQFVCIGVLSLGCSLLTQLTVSAQSKMPNDSIKNYKLREIEVVAAQEKSYASLARASTVVNRSEIVCSPSLSLPEMLREVPGLDVRQRGEGDVQSDISIRGGSTDQMLVLLNGVDVTDPQTGHYAMDLPIDLSAVNSIEVLRGPAARLLGANAFSGAINVLTDKNTTGGTVQLVAGQHGLVSPRVSYNYRKGKVAAFGAASYSRSEGYMYNTDFHIGNVFASVSVDSTWIGKLSIQAGYQDKSYGANAFYSLKYPSQYEKTHSTFASVSSDKHMGEHFFLLSKVYWRQHLDCFELFRDFEDAPIWYKNHNYHQTDVAGAGATANYLSKIGTTTLGVDARYEHIFSNVLGDDLSKPREVWFTSDSAYFTKEKGRMNLSAFANQSVHIGKFSFSAGINGTYSDDFGSHYCFGTDAAYEIIKGLNVTTCVNQALRLPSFTDLYYKSATQLANPDLKPEKAVTYEIGLNEKLGGFAASIAGYYRHGRDVIDWVRYPDEDVWKSMNHTEVNALGGEANVEYRFSNPYIRRIQASATLLTIDKHSGDYVSKYALDYLKRKFTVSLTHKVYKNIFADWRFIYQQRGGNYIDVKNQTQTYDDVFLTDLRLKRQSKGRSIFVEVDNLFNKSYYDYGGISQPGRWVKGGISVDF